MCVKGKEGNERNNDKIEMKEKGRGEERDEREGSEGKEKYHD